MDALRDLQQARREIRSLRRNFRPRLCRVSCKIDRVETLLKSMGRFKLAKRFRFREKDAKWSSKVVIQAALAMSRPGPLPISRRQNCSRRSRKKSPRADEEVRHPVTCKNYLHLAYFGGIPEPWTPAIMSGGLKIQNTSENSPLLSQGFSWRGAQRHRRQEKSFVVEAAYFLGLADRTNI